MLVELNDRSLSLHQRICNSQLTEDFTLGSDKISPMKHLYLRDTSLSHLEQQRILKKIVDYVSDNSLGSFIKCGLTLKRIIEKVVFQPVTKFD